MYWILVQSLRNAAEKSPHVARRRLFWYIVLARTCVMEGIRRRTRDVLYLPSQVLLVTAREQIYRP
jgi:hypothetical protein